MKPLYDLNKWKTWNWKSNVRYYQLSLSQNLFYQWIITKKWGGLRTQIQGSQTIYCKSTNEINDIFTDTHKRRLARGYILVQYL